MIQSAHHNGINFSGDFARKSNIVNFDGQRVKNKLPRDLAIYWLLFSIEGVESDGIDSAKLTAKSSGADVDFSATLIDYYTGGALLYFQISTNSLELSDATYFQLTANYTIDETPVTESIYSEIYEVVNFSGLAAAPIMVTATNNDDRHGFLANQAFGFFEAVGFNESFFINTKTEYEKSYNRKLILKSENNIGRRITFKNLTAYNQNLLRWLCNCENLYFDGVKYELISDFTELLSDAETSEIKDLRADFLLSNQSFFAPGVSEIPKNVFTKSFFIK